MTACVNNEKKMKGGALTGKVARTFLAGALAATMVPSVAFADVEQSGEASALSVVQNSWANYDFGWNVDADKYGDFYVTVGEDFYLTSISDVFGTPVSISDATVVYVDGSNNYYFETPDAVGTYDVHVVKGAYAEKDLGDGDGTGWDGQDVSGNTLTMFSTEVNVEAKSLDGAFACEDGDVSDTAFKYNGRNLDVTFADADGNVLEADVDYDTSASNIPTVKAAGTYTATLKGKGDYAGSSKSVTFKVEAIDLSKDEITVLPVKVNTGAASFGAGAWFSGDDEKLSEANAIFLVNGELVEAGVLGANATGAVKSDGTVVKYVEGDHDSEYGGTLTPAMVTMTVKAGDAADPDSVKNTKAGVEMSIVADLAKIEYDDAANSTYGVIAGLDGKTFVTSKGQAFDADLITAEVSGEDVPFDVVITKDGAEVEDCSAPGKYSVEVTVGAPKDLAYAGYASAEFTVVASQFTEIPKAYVKVDGKDATNSASAEYDGQAVSTQVLVKDGDKELVEGTDYKVSYENAKGETVDSIVEPGKYTLVIDYLGTATKGNPTVPVADDKVSITVGKAVVRSAKADKDVYEYTGQAVAPTFTAYNGYDCEGLSVAVDPSKTAVVYYKAALADTDKDGVADSPYKVDYNKAGEDVSLASTTDKAIAYSAWAVAGDPIAASDLKAEGFYVAVVSAPAGDAHFAGTAVQGALFEVSEFAKFEDVSAGAWYADVVYKARDNGYMSGIAGTKLFMPEAGITRSEIACVMFNMAGQAPETDKTFPTAFSDAAADAWYSQAVSWASQAGVMNGYAGTDLFGVSDKTTREQVAAIFYNYAKSQGKDVSVKDVDGTLAKYADGSQVSPWMREAVAWAVENGVMGNGTALSPLEDVTRAQVAAMAVNFQPEALK